jgi:hypothetical protein
MWNVHKHDSTELDADNSFCIVGKVKNALRSVNDVEHICEVNTMLLKNATRHHNSCEMG